MSAAAAAEAPPPAKGKKKLIVIVAVAVLVLVLGGVAAMLMTKKKGGDAEGEADDKPAAAKAVSKTDPKALPVFVPLDPFTVNLADRDAERYAQVGITLEIDDVKTGEQIKVYTPAIRNNILMAIADRTAGDLMGREGKARLASKIRNEVSRALGYEVEDEEEETEAEEEEKPAAKKKKKKKKVEAVLPVRAVHFSNFIIQ